jgi:hypothetical protein
LLFPHLPDFERDLSTGQGQKEELEVLTIASHSSTHSQVCYRLLQTATATYGTLVVLVVLKGLQQFECLAALVQRNLQQFTIGLAAKVKAIQIPSPFQRDSNKAFKQRLNKGHTLEKTLTTLGSFVWQT